MSFWSLIAGMEPNTKDYDRGYDAAEEFHEMIDHEPTDEEWDMHCKAVKSGHSQDYVDGYSDYLEDASEEGLVTSVWNWVKGH